MQTIALRSHIDRPVPPEIIPALRLLLRVYDHAEDAQVEPWQFAVEIQDLKPAGLTRGDIRWLISKGYVEHARETTIPGDRARSFRFLPATAISDDACFTLTETGARHFRRALAAVPTPVLASLPTIVANISEDFSPPISTGSHPDLALPEWDENRRELRYRGQLVKRYRVPAENQQRILAAFAEEGWPEFIDDPLPPAPDQEPKRRLQATLKALNRRQVTALLTFHGNGNGCKVYWEEVVGGT